MKRYFLWPMVIALLVSACSVDRHAGVEAGNSTIAGVIKDSLLHPVVGALVELESSEALQFVTIKDTTDSNGAFAFTELDSSAYILSVFVDKSLWKSQTVVTASNPATSTLSINLGISPQPLFSVPHLIAQPFVCADSSLCGIFKDSRDSTNYRWVAAGGLKWMAENLNYMRFFPNGSWCAFTDPSFCGTYGSLYDWSTAQTVCPQNWRLPSSQEWSVLMDSIRTQKSVMMGSEGLYLRAVVTASASWVSKGDPYGFSGLPGGMRLETGAYKNVSEDGYWWTSSDDLATNKGIAFYLLSTKGIDALFEGILLKDYGFSVRCVSNLP